MKTFITISLAFVASFLVVEAASAQILVSPWGGFGVHLGAPTVGLSTPVRNVSAGGAVTRVGRLGVGRLSVGRLGPRLLRNHVVMPQVITTPQVVIGATGHVTPTVGTITNADFLGNWRVYAPHVEATMTLSPTGYRLASPGHHEVGVWSWHGTRSLLGSHRFALKLTSSQGRSTTFQGQWTAPGREFQMTSLNSGLTYTVVRTY